MRHASGEWSHRAGLAGFTVVSHEEGRRTPFRIASISTDITDQDGTAELLSLAKTAPHHCDDPECPGNVNRQRLEAWGDLYDALTTMRDHYGHTASYCEDCDRHAPKHDDGRLAGPISHHINCPIGRAEAALGKAKGAAR